MVLVVDDEDRENEGDLIMAAEWVTAESMAFLIRHTSGLICVGITEDRAVELDLPIMVDRADDPRGTAFTVSVDLRHGTTTGVSASDRALTVRALADPATRPHDLTRPGHVFPLRARPGGVLERPGHTESAVDLCRLAGLEPVGVLAEVTNDDGSMAKGAELAAFATEHHLAMLSVADIVRYRQERGGTVRRGAAGRVPCAYGQFTAISFTSVTDGREHVAFTLGDVYERGGTTDDPVLVRVHSECLTGDVFGSLRCDCGEQLDRALQRIGEVGRGAVIYLRGHEGRGTSLLHKLRAYALQDAGLDTVDANTAQGLPVDDRDYSVAAEILGQLGISSVFLMTNNPAKEDALARAGVQVAGREPLIVPPNTHNVRYLTTKRTRMQHALGEGEVS